MNAAKGGSIPHSHGPNGHPPEAVTHVELQDLRSHLDVCHCSLVKLWGALIDEVETARTRVSEAAPEAQEEGPTQLRLMEAFSTVTGEGRARADVWLEAAGRPVHGHGVGETAIAGTHVAVARATVDALHGIIGTDASLESVTLCAHPSDPDAIRIVVTLDSSGQERVGGATSPPAAERFGAALAVIDALRPEFRSAT